MKCYTAISRTHEHCCRFLAAAGAIYNDTYRIALEATDLAKISATALRIAAKEFKKPAVFSPNEKVRFLSAITNKGPILLSETAKTLCDRTYLLDDAYGASSKLLLSALRSHALAAGYEIISCYCPLSPFDKLEYLFVPQLRLGFMSSNELYPTDIRPCTVIHSRRFTDEKLLRLRKKRISFNRKSALQMILQAAKLLAEAKNLHDELESYYVQAMDFQKVNKKTDAFVKQIHQLSSDPRMQTS